MSVENMDVLTLCYDLCICISILNMAHSGGEREARVTCRLDVVAFIASMMNQL